jgi:Trk-type K+ transport system membrane component
MLLVRINLMRQDLTARYSRFGKVENRPTCIKKLKFFWKEPKILIYRLLIIICFTWLMLIHLSNADKYYQALVFGAAVWFYLVFQCKLHKK